MTCSLAPRAHAQTETAAAVSWLRSQQNADGTWGPDPQLAARDTAEVVRTLVELDPHDLAAISGLNALAGRASETVDLEARRLTALRRSLPAGILESDLSALAGLALSTGGWGFDARSAQADALDTALALRALAASSSLNVGALLAALSTLANLQSADGGFAQAIGEPADLGTSAEVLATLGALAALTNVSALRDRTAAFLTGSINADGGFPGFRAGESDPTMTALVVTALLESGSNVSGVTAAREYLRAAQLPNGSWANDAYTTALAARVLGNAKADLSVDSFVLSSAAVQQGTPVQGTVTVRNAGLGPSTPTTLAVFRGDPNAGGVLMGSVPLGALGVGASFMNAFTIETASSNGTVALFAVADPGGLVPEYAETNNRRLALLVVRPFGQLPPASDNQTPIITNVAPQSVISGTVYAHAVQAIDPEGGALRYALTFFDGQQAPTGMAINPATGLITWTAGAPGSYSFGISVRDPQGATGFQQVGLQVIAQNEKRPPVFETFPIVAAAPGLLYTYPVSVRDPDGGPVTLRLATAPGGMTLDPSTTTVRWTPTANDSGEHVVRLIATDDEGTSADQSWTVIVDGASSGGIDLVAMHVDPALRRTDPQTLAVSGTASVDVANQGTVAAGKFDVAVFEDRDGKPGLSADDVVVGRASVDSLASGGRSSVVVALSGTSLFLDHALSLAVDPEGAVKELRKDNNVVTAGHDRTVLTVPGSFSPVLKLDHRSISPTDPNINIGLSSNYLVAQLNDDNGDGKAGDGDIPDLIFAVFDRWSFTPSKLRAIDGRTGRLIFQTTFDITQNTPAIAVGDVDGDGFPEIFAMLPDATARIGAINRDGTLRWSTALPASRADIALADMDGDGVSEIIVGSTVLNADGTIRCQGPSQGPGATTVIADIDLDGKPEILNGVDVFRSDCSLMYTRPFPLVSNGSHVYNVVAQLDDDPEPEIITVFPGFRTDVYEHTGALKWRVANQTGGGTVSAGDLDGDGWPEVVAEGGSFVRVYDRFGTLRWTHPINDPTTDTQSMTLADLDGDGRMEVVMMDAAHLYIINGRDGRDLFVTNRFSGTGIEYPTIADADGDGRADIIFGNDNNISGDPNAHGLRVWGDPHWAPARPLWNQFNYHVTNIGCDQTIPRHELPQWQVLNSYLAAQEIPEQFAEALNCVNGPADLSVSYLRVDRSACSAQVRYVARVGNGGVRTVTAGARVNFRQAAPSADPVAVGTAATTKSLAPGQFEDVSVTIAAGGSGTYTIFAALDPSTVARDDPPGNNAHAISVELCGVENRPPVFASSPPLTATVGAPYGYTPITTDPDQDLVTVTLTTGPAGMALVDPGFLAWTPTAAQLGSHSVALQASDGRGGLVLQEFVVVVEAGVLKPPPAPNPAGNLRLLVGTDSPTYSPNGSAHVNVQVLNDANVGRAGDLTVDVLDPAGAPAATLQNGLTVLFTGAGTQTFTSSFGVGIRRPGTYQARAVYREGSTQTTAVADLVVLPVGGLDVVLTTDHQSYGPNQSVQITRRLANPGPNAPETALGVTVEVLSPTGTSVFSNIEPPLDLGPGVISTETLSFATAMRPPGVYRARITVTQGSTQLVQQERTFTISAAGTLTGTLTVDPVRVAPDGDLTLTTNLTNTGNGPVTLSLLFTVLDSGTLTVVKQATVPLALALGESSSAFVNFAASGLDLKRYLARVEASQGGATLATLSAPFTVVDDQPPAVSITVPPCSGAPVTPLVTIVEFRLESVEKLLDGQPYDGSPVGEGSHTLTVRATDHGGLVGTASATFVVDLTPPVIAVIGVTAGHAYATPVTPAVSFTDANLVSSATTLNGGSFTSGTTVSADGPYTLAATAQDCAGHVAQQRVPFLVDRTAPVLTIDVPACSADSVSPTITVAEANVATDVRTLDGAAYTGTPVSDEGSHALHVAVTDLAGNGANSDASFIIDRQAPTVTITGVTDGTIFSGPVTPTIQVSDANLEPPTTTLNGAPYVSGTTVSAVGTYTLTVTAVDCAGNRTVRTVNFEIGNPAPQFSGRLSHDLSPRGHVLIATECPGCPPAPARLRSVLTSSQVPFEEATGRTSWLTKLRSGDFNVHVAYGIQPPESGTAFAELNEAAWLGDGLVFITSHSDAMPSLRESLGLDLQGALPSLPSITLSSPLQPATVTSTAAGVFFKLQGALGLGIPTGTPNRTVAASHGVGLGKALSFGWDSETSSSDSLYQSMLAAAAPATGAPLLPGGRAELRATVTNTGSNTSTYTVTHTLGTGLTTTDALSEMVTLPAGGTAVLFLGLKLPAQSGVFAVSGTLAVGSSTVDSDTFTLTVARSRAQIETDLAAALRALSLTAAQANKRDQAVTDVQQASTSPPATAIGLVLGAIDLTRQITAVDTTAIRIDLARLLRAHQLGWQP